MELDRDAVNKLLSLSDFQLKRVLSRLASDYGLDLSSFNIGDNTVVGIRKALSGASDEDIKKASEQIRQFEEMKKKGRS